MIKIANKITKLPNKQFTVITIIAILHIGATLFSLTISTAIIMAEFEGKFPPSPIDNILLLIFQILSFPLIYVGGYLVRGLPLGPLWMILNGLLWGYVIVRLYGFLKYHLKLR